MQISEEQVQKAMKFLKESRGGKTGGKKKTRSVKKKAIDPETKAAHDRAKSEIDKLPEIREKRVKKVKEELESSEYEVTECEIAKKMLGRAISDKIE